MIRKSVEQLQAYVPGEQPQGGDLVKLNTNENPYPPSPRVAEVLARFNIDKLRTYPDPVSLRLRREIGRIHGCTEQQVFVGNGSDEVLALCTRAFVENDGSIGYFEPSYSLYPVLADIRDVERRPVELDEDFRWMMPASFQSSLFFLANPNAPTGMSHPVGVIREFCATHRGVVVVDEAYVDFADENCVDIALRQSNVLVARTLSKSYSLAGLRLGYAVGDQRLIEALMKIKDSYNNCEFSQMVGLAAVADQEWMNTNVARIKTTRARLTSELRQRGFLVCSSQANFLWVKPTSIDAESLFAQLRERRIFVRHFPGVRTKEYLRITVGTDCQIDRLLAAMDDIIRV